MKIMIVGGTGFLGYYTVLAALKEGHEVASLGIKDIELGDWWPKEVPVHYVDVFQASEDELVPFFKGYDAVVYSVGPDDRVTPPAPAYEFFHVRLVDHCAKTLRAAERAGVRRAVVYNSYFAYFDRKRPEVGYASKHPYVKARIEQAELCIAQAKTMDVMILELPYIFGSMPERIPLWKATFLDRFANGKKTIMFPRGATTMIAVEHVGEAGVGALAYGKHGERYPIGEVNTSYDHFLNIMMETLLGKRRKIVHPARALLVFGVGFMKRADRKKGLEAGLDMKYVMKDIMTHETFIAEEDLAYSRKTLHLTTGGLDEAIRATALACYKPGEFK